MKQNEMDRRAFIGVAGLAGVGAIAAITGCSSGTGVESGQKEETGMTSISKKIDIHRHPAVEGGVDAMHADFDWTMDYEIESLEEMGFSGGLLWTPLAGENDLIRQRNEAIAELVSPYPDLYGSAGSINYADVDASLAEIEHIYDDLGMDGVVVVSNCNGVYPSDASLGPIWEELNRREAVVFLHPVAPPYDAQAAIIAEYPIDTARSIVNFVLTGGLRKYPDIKWVVSHCGGALLSIAHRVSLVCDMIDKIPFTSQDFLDDLGKLYYDFSIASTELMFPAVKRVAGADHMLYGTDSHTQAMSALQLADEALTNTDAFTAEEKELIFHGTAEALFPRFK